MDSQNNFAGLADTVREAQKSYAATKIQSEIQSAAMMGKTTVSINRNLPSQEAIDQLQAEGFDVTILSGKVIIDWANL